MLQHKKLLEKVGNKMDQRVRYTKKVIRESFLNHLKTTPIDKITVRSICLEAEINRATFYKYYDNAYDLLDKLEDEILSELVHKIKDENITDFLDVFRYVLLDVKDKYEVYEVLFDKNDDGEFRQRLFDICYMDNIKTIQTIFADLGEREQKWVYYFIAEGLIGLFNTWIKGGMKDDVEDIVNFARKLVDGINAGSY